MSAQDSKGFGHSGRSKCVTAAIDNRLLKPKIEIQSFIQAGNENYGCEVISPANENRRFGNHSKLLLQSTKKLLYSVNPMKPMKLKEKLKLLRLEKMMAKRRLVKRHNALRIDGQIEELMQESKRIEKLDPNIKVIRMETAPDLIDPKAEILRLSKSPIWTTSKLLTNSFRALDSSAPKGTPSWKKTFKDLKEMQGLLEESKSKAKYRRRMLDIVLGDNNPYRTKIPLSERIQGYLPENVQSMPLMKNVYNLLDVFSKHNGEPNYKFLSPRFLSVVPEPKNIRHSMSPNLFPMYNDESPNSVLPIPKLLKATGMSEEDRDAVLELIMQTSGAKTIVDETLSTLKKSKMLGLEDDISGITKFIHSLFKKLEKTFNTRQKRELKGRQYTFLSKDQMLMLFGPEGVYNTTEFPFDLDEYESWSEVEKKKALYHKIRILAGEAESEETHSRRKRQTTLSPAAFSPSVLDVTVIAPVTLSPSMFSPSILYVAVLSPPIISPQLANPMIFSPYFLGPNTLSAAVMNAYVFTPYVLSPNVINPYVMSPVILSPFVLSPDVLSPTILSGTVLSPAVASPSVYSPNAFAADVLSPTVFS